MLPMKNIAREPNVSLFWPPTEPGDYTLIINGTAASKHQLTGVTMAEITLTKPGVFRAVPVPLPCSMRSTSCTASARPGRAPAKDAAIASGRGRA